MLILFVYTFFIQSKQSSHVFCNNYDIFCQVAQDRGASCFSFLFALFMLIWLRYTKVQHNNHKTIFKIIFFCEIPVFPAPCLLQQGQKLSLSVLISTSLECFLCCFVKLVRCQWTNYYFDTTKV